MDPGKPTDLYWETEDGKNNFLVRMKRCEDFCKLAAELKIDVAQGVNSDLELDHWMSIAQYYQHKGNDYESILAFLNYADLDLLNPAVLKKLEEYGQKLLGAILSPDTPRLNGFPAGAPAGAILKRIRAVLAQARLEEKYDKQDIPEFSGKR